VKKSDCLLRTNDCRVLQNTSGSKVVLTDDKKQMAREKLNLDAKFNDITGGVRITVLCIL
jgi:hypothetical protein